MVLLCSVSRDGKVNWCPKTEKALPSGLRCENCSVNCILEKNIVCNRDFFVGAEGLKWHDEFFFGGGKVPSPS